MKLSKKLSAAQFIISQLLILITGLTFLFGLYYMLNIQYQKKGSPFLNGPITSMPKNLRLNLDNPDNMSLTFQNSTIVSGQTIPLAEVLIYTDSKDLVIISKKDGSFSTSWDLNEGENNITVVAFSPEGDYKSDERTIYFSKEKI